MISLQRTTKMLLTILLFPAFSWSVHAGEIHNAAIKGDLNQVKSILSANPDLLDTKNSKGFTPLHSAISKGKKTVAVYLIDQGANINAKNKNGLPPLFQALDLGKTGIAKILIRKGANLNFRGYRRRTILHMAARSGNVVIIKLLLEKGAEINAKDSKGSTPIDLALLSANEKAACFLKQKGGILNTVDTEKDEFRVLLNRAINRGQTELVGVMVDFSKKPDLSNETGITLLHRAAAIDKKEIVQLLLEKGVNINEKDTKGRTPLYMAKKYGHNNLAEFLIANSAKENTTFNSERYSFKENIKGNDAVIYYLGHSGWAIKTKNHFLIFDYYERQNSSDSPSLVNGHIVSSEIADQNVTVFVTHGHSDHYDSKILSWKKSIKNIQYVFGFKPRRVAASKYQYLGPKQKKNINGIEINTIKSTDKGVGFLIKVDGLVIYHAGDHANKKKTSYNEYHKEIDYLSQIENKIDIAFILTGSACGGGAPICVLEGDFYAIEKLQPKVVFPMHCDGKEELYLDFAKKAAMKNISAKVVAAEFRGDEYYYQEGIIK